jgi:hypothetical protein
MENLLSSSAASHDHDTLPDNFVFSADQRPPAAAVALPVIDISAPCDEVRHVVLEAGKELGFFQVTSLLLSTLLQLVIACWLTTT